MSVRASLSSIMCRTRTCITVSSPPSRTQLATHAPTHTTTAPRSRSHAVVRLFLIFFTGAESILLFLHLVQGVVDTSAFVVGSLQLLAITCVLALLTTEKYARALGQSHVYASKHARRFITGPTPPTSSLPARASPSPNATVRVVSQPHRLTALPAHPPTDPTPYHAMLA